MKAPLAWKVGRKSMPAEPVTGDLFECWRAFAEHVRRLPKAKYPRLHQLVETRKCGPLNELALEVCDLLDALTPDDGSRVRLAGEDLCYTIIDRKLHWSRDYIDTDAYLPPPDPALLVLDIGE